MRNLLLYLFLMLILCALLLLFFPQEGEAIKERKPVSQEEAVKAGEPQPPQQIVSQKSQDLPAPSQLDRSISILNCVATLMGVLIAVATFIFVILGAILGFIGIKSWRDYKQKLEEEWSKYKQEIEEDAKYIKELRIKAEEDAEKIRIKFVETPLPPLPERPSKENLEELEEFARKVEILEILGVPLRPEHYFYCGYYFFYEGKFNRALKAFDKAIELKPDDAEAWNGKGLTLRKLNRLEEALEVRNRVIELRPDLAKAWFNRACTYSLKGEREKALSDLKRAIELDASFKEKAKKDADFKGLWGDEEFKKVTGDR